MIKRKIESLEDAGDLAGYYVEADGGYELQVDGPGSEDVTKLKAALAAERSAHKETKSRSLGSTCLLPKFRNCATARTT